jgi:uncharacterized glyoxalase superfamily protein PhnB
MTESKLKTPEGMHTITPHIVVNDAAAATDWYKQVLGAEERSRIEVPGGKLMQVELWFGDSVVMLADEFPSWASSRRSTLAAPPPSCTCHQRR